jgi:hypothetical protein
VSGAVRLIYRVEFNPHRLTVLFRRSRALVNVGDCGVTEADRGFDLGIAVDRCPRRSAAAPGEAAEGGACAEALPLKTSGTDDYSG